MSDVTKTGDSFYTNEKVDNVLVSRDGFCQAATIIYAKGHDLSDPLLSPVYGDMHGFPPAILTTGTRDLLLSNTVRVHRKLLRSGVPAILEVFEGESHARNERGLHRDRRVLRPISRPLTGPSRRHSGPAGADQAVVCQGRRPCLLCP
jgi:acetyl esterase/lipase